MHGNKVAKRPYRQTARAAAAEATAQRILDAFTSRLRDRWFDEITLDDIAQEAGVTVQTVIRRFGGKDGLLDAAHQRFGTEIRRRRDVPQGDAARALDAIIDDYETIGDLIIRVLAQEDRYAPLRAVSDIGRAVHRAWTGEIFAPWLRLLPERDRTSAHDALVVATDIYVWKLVRRDMNRSRAELRAIMAQMIAAALRVPEQDLFELAAGDRRYGSR